MPLFFDRVAVTAGTVTHDAGSETRAISLRKRVVVRRSAKMMNLHIR
jgi:hypothetical protein